MRRAWEPLLRACYRSVQDSLSGPSSTRVHTVQRSLLELASPHPAAGIPLVWQGSYFRRGLNAGALHPGLSWRTSRLRREFDDALECVRRAQFDTLKELARARSRWEARTVALLNSLTLSSSGQYIVGVGGACLATSLFAPSWASCYSVIPRPPPAPQPRPELTQTTKLGRTLSALARELGLWCRATYLWLVFTPVLVTAPFCLLTGVGRAWWMDLVRWTLERSGPAFIKWGQWGATRPDLFPPDLCRSLEHLHHQAPRHNFSQSKKEVEKVFGMQLEEMFCEFDTEPIASGSIAQIHRARLSPSASSQSGHIGGTEVAVKVRHPGVSALMQKDFALMIRMCRLASCIPFLSELRLEESIRQFGGPMHEQLDLTWEAKNLERFISNFRWWRTVNFPKPVMPFVTPSVLVETFEKGDSISGYVRNPDGEDSVRISQIGLDMYIKMLVSDNFLHADLHPGNILVRPPLKLEESWTTRFCAAFNIKPRPRLVLLDAGMVTELTPQDQTKVVGFLRALTQRDGAELAHNILSLSEQPLCPNPAAFVEDMKVLFDGLDIETIRKYSADVIQDMLEQVRVHRVNLKGSVSTLVATTLVLEGWSTKLNPDISIIDQIRESLPGGSEDQATTALDKIVAMGSVAEL